ncbi:hypothetical protein ARMSODRAFT_1024074 [Armillaria solidipes]|uniref:Uncharacterized protein n=1 Tax=Armillaria solidipes TaxID=1076256 RepID=A0A2H3AXA5_9AGAR|nr:hypothetical protein ARMSODRAFT_1024074 [Armillaria solidipes]
MSQDPQRSPVAGLSQAGIFETEPLPQNPIQSPSSLLHIDPQVWRAPLPGLKTPSHTKGHLSPIKFPLPQSPTPRNPAPALPTTPENLALPSCNEPGKSPIVSSEEDHGPPPALTPLMKLDEAIWLFMMKRAPIMPDVLEEAEYYTLIAHYIHELPEDPNWLLTKVGVDYEYFGNLKVLVGYILQKEAEAAAAHLWNRIHPLNQGPILPSYVPSIYSPLPSPKHMPITPETLTPMPIEPPRTPHYANVSAYPLKPHTHGGGPVGSCPRSS